MPETTTIVLHLSSIDELFMPPATNPFSTHEVDILGEAGLDIAQKQVARAWPRLPRTIHLTMHLPPNQVTPDLAQRTCAALQHYCATKIDDNQLQRKLAMRRSLRQLVGAFIAIAVALAFIVLLLATPLGLIPGFLRGVLIVLALYACSVLSFDALWSLAFDWVPFVQENAVYRALQGTEVRIEPVLNPPASTP